MHPTLTCVLGSKVPHDPGLMSSVGRYLLPTHVISVIPYPIENLICFKCVTFIMLCSRSGSEVVSLNLSISRNYCNHFNSRMD